MENRQVGSTCHGGREVGSMCCRMDGRVARAMGGWEGGGTFCGG